MYGSWESELSGVRRQFGRGTSILWSVLLCIGLVGCDPAVIVENAPPRVTWLAVQPAQDGVSVLTVWILDLEGDPVDLEMTWAEEGEIDAQTMTFAEGGHGLVGLTTRDGRLHDNGQHHEFRWKVDDIPSDQQVQLTVAATDRHAGFGESVTSPAFTLAQGLPEPVSLP